MDSQYLCSLSAPSWKLSKTKSWFWQPSLYLHETQLELRAAACKLYQPQEECSGVSLV